MDKEVPTCPMAVLPMSFYCLRMFKTVRFFRLLPIAVAAESLIWL
jgi:hypothetical protein